jgi:hypothetical protein
MQAQAWVSRVRRAVFVVHHWNVWLRQPDGGEPFGDYLAGIDLKSRSPLLRGGADAGRTVCTPGRMAHAAIMKAEPSIRLTEGDSTDVYAEE